VNVSDGEYALFQSLIEREAGIYLSECKRALLISRLQRRLRELELPTFSAYYRRVLADPVERVRFVDAICTNETHFFREAHHFEYLERTLIPRWLAAARAGQRPRKVRIWSAGCSTGEEPYSIAMVLGEHLEGWEIEIVATDVSTKVLDAARAAIYKNERLHEVPWDRRRWILRGTGPQEGKFKVGPEARVLVQFRALNLIDDVYDVGDALDAVFCRNVLIYFRSDTRERTVRRLVDKLAIGGQLFLGHAESLQSSRLHVRTVIPTVYERVR
jgi:chemotaxis protein methyltransferase CheR